MIAFLKPKRTPIGIDIGARVVKLVQLSADGSRILESGRWDLPLDAHPGSPDFAGHVVQALKQARDGKRFHGRDAVVCLSPRHYVVQNVRVPKGEPFQIEQAARQECSTRLPFPPHESELRFIESVDVRQTDGMKREVIVLAVHKPVLDQMLSVVEEAGYLPVAVEVEPTALLRVYQRQYRRGEDQSARSMFVHIGHANTVVFIAQADEILFIKNLDLGGKHFDEAVAKHLEMSVADAWSLRRHNGDRRAEQQDADVALSVNESCRPVIEKLINEVSLCVRYHSVTFRGQPLKRLILAGGEATPTLAEAIGTRLNLKCELGDPLRAFESNPLPGRKSQWDLALGLALNCVDS
jgi:type IV pilus assembly protein PilM